MPAGDAGRRWFPEMIDLLRAEWNSEIWCPVWQTHRRSAAPRVSVRAMILSVGRLGIASAADSKQLEKRWSKYREDNGLPSLKTPRYHEAAQDVGRARLGMAVLDCEGT